MICDMNCFECKYEDCINDEIYLEDYRQSEEISRLAEAKKPYGGSIEKKAYCKAYYEANRDKIKAYNKRYREANRNRLNEYRKAYYKAHAEELKAYSRAHYKAYTEEIKAYGKACYKERRKAERGAGDEARKKTDQKTETASGKL